MPTGTYRLSKRQLHRPATGAIEQAAPTLEPEVDRLWTSEQTFARIAEFMEQVSGSGGRGEPSTRRQTGHALTAMTGHSC